jgi:uncharacterized protein
MRHRAAPPHMLRSAAGTALFDAERGVLLASRCTRCEELYFPPRALCPACFMRGAMVEQALPRQGTVRASTVVRVPSALGHKPPYAFGSVGLAGIDVFTRFTGAPPECFVPGLGVELAFETLRVETLGELLIHVFRPQGLA